MYHFETMKWSEIVVSGSHTIDIGSLSKEAQDRLEDIGQDDLDELFSLRVTGRGRLIGIREMDYFRILWWDPDHKVCPSKKKHT